MAHFVTTYNQAITLQIVFIVLLHCAYNTSFNKAFDCNIGIQLHKSGARVGSGCCFQLLPLIIMASPRCLCVRF